VLCATSPPASISDLLVHAGVFPGQLFPGPGMGGGIPGRDERSRSVVPAENNFIVGPFSHHRHRCTVFNTHIVTTLDRYTEPQTYIIEVLQKCKMPAH